MHPVPQEEEQRNERIWEAEQRMTLMRKTKEDGMQTWSEEEEGKEQNNSQNNKVIRECLFTTVCVVAVISMKTVIILCV